MRLAESVALFFLFFSLELFADISVVRVFDVKEVCDGKLMLRRTSQDPLNFKILNLENGEENNFSFSSNQLNASVDNLCVAQYVLKYEDSVGCKYEIPFDVSQCSTISYLYNVRNVCSENSVQSGEISISVSQPYSTNIVWSNKYQGHTNSGLRAGEYTATITDIGGCTGEAVFNVLNDFLEIEIAHFSVDPSTGSGRIEVDFSGGNGIYNVDWQSLGVLDFVELSDNVVEFRSQGEGQITLLVEDGTCSIEEQFLLEDCSDISETDVYFDFFESTVCSGGSSIYIKLLDGGKFQNVKVTKLSNEVVVYDENIIFGDKLEEIHVGNVGMYRIALTNICGHVESFDIDVNCDCSDSILPFLTQIESDGACPDKVDRVLVTNINELEFLCQLSSDSPNYVENGVCDLDSDWIYYIKLPFNNGVLKVEKSGNSLTWTEVIDSDKIDLENGDYTYEMGLGLGNEFYISSGFGCVDSPIWYLNTNYDDEPFRLNGVHIATIYGFQVQIAWFKCKTCQIPNFPISYLYRNRKAICDDDYSSEFFNYGPFSLDEPFLGGGAFNVVGQGQVVIPPNTPHIEVPPRIDISPTNRAAIFFAGYAAGPVFNNVDIYVEYDFANNDNDDGSNTGNGGEGVCILNCDCPNEYVEEIDGSCDLNYYCFEEEVFPGDDDAFEGFDMEEGFVGVIPNESAIIPCRAIIDGVCLVLGCCTAVNDYYVTDSGDYFVYNEESCDNNSIPYSQDVFSGNYTEYSASCSEDCFLGQNFPNPFVENTTLPICIAQESELTLMVYSGSNCNGEVLLVLNLGVFSAGEHHYLLSSDLLPGTGVYCFKIVSDHCESVSITSIVVGKQADENADLSMNDISMYIHDETVVEGNVTPFVAYPNPNGGGFVIKLNNGLVLRKVRLFDVNGRAVNLSYDGTSKESINVNIESPVSGVYTLVLETDSKVFFDRIVVVL